MPKSVIATITALSLLVAALWTFPAFWYRPPDPNRAGFFWLNELTEVPGWKFEMVPVGKAAEAVLVADRLFNGDFSRADGTVIQAYGAKRYLEKENEIGLFSHTPDRCWTAVGWRMIPSTPDHLDMQIHGLQFLFERRIFSLRGKQQLVYFGAVVGGKPLPYRLDQYMSAASNQSYSGKGDTAATWRRLGQLRLWSWAWESFVNRTPLSGPQQFIRISTSIQGDDVKAGDAILTQFLPQWLKPVSYASDQQEWLKAARAEKPR